MTRAVQQVVWVSVFAGACATGPMCQGIETACTGCDAHQQLALCLAWDEGLGRDHVDYWVEDIGWPRYNVQAYTRLDCAAAEFTTVIVDVELERVDAWGTGRGTPECIEVIPAP